MMLRQFKWECSRQTLAAGAALGVLLSAAPALAEVPQSASVSAPESAVATMVRLLVEEGVISAEKGQALLRRAEAEMAQKQEQMPGVQQAARPDGSGNLTPPAPGTVRVPYVPQTVRDQIKEELRTEVMAEAKADGWASPGTAAPDWVHRVRLHGDLRLRSASTFYSKNNSNLIIDVGSWNATGPHDVLAPQFVVPTLNATNDRINTAQIRARIGLDATLSDWLQMGFQLATGDNPGPISTNAALGGGFRKRDVWLQNAYVRGEPMPGVTAMLGRFDNPLRTTDLMFDSDLAFDGVYGEVDFGRLFGQDFTLALRGGAFPINFGDDDFPSTSINKRNFRDQYLYSAQLEAGKTFENGVDVRLSGAYHNFTYLRGHVSDPCDIYASDQVECSTDALRPMFMGKGNTWAYLRSFDLTNLQPGEAPREPQYVGYKFAFRVLDINGSVTVPISDGIVARLTGTYLYNFGFDPKNVCREGFYGQPQNNISDSSGACDAGHTGRFVGGNEGYAGYLAIGHSDLFSFGARKARKGQWALTGAYKYLESDAVPDAFADSDFHLGGTNAKGYVIGGVYAPFNNVTLSARWLSANEIVDQPLAIDVLHVNLEVAF